MEIPGIGNSLFQNGDQAQPARYVSPDAPDQVEDDTVEIGNPDKKEPVVYDQMGNITDPQKSQGKNRSQAPENKTNPEKDASGLSEADLKQVAELQQADREVRAHEMAHMAAGGSLVRGGVHFEYRKGPDGNSYAVGGEVSIDTSKERDPVKTLIKMQQVQAAAMAPADPSPQDRAVAAAAAQTAQQARVEIAKEAAVGKSSSSGGPAGDKEKLKQEQSQDAYKKASIPLSLNKSLHTVA